MVSRLNKKSLLFLVSLLIFSLLPLALGDNRHIMHLLIMSFIWSVVVAAWDLSLGYARVFNFGQVAFFGMGAYTSAMLTLNYGISPWLGILVAGAGAAVLGFLIGLPCLRLRGIYIGITTFAVSLVLPRLIIAGYKYGTGGSWGLPGVPPLVIGGYTLANVNLVPWYYVTLGIFAIALFAIYKIINSPIGLAFMALRDSAPFAKSLGINDYRYMLILFTISASIAGGMGGVYVHYLGAVSPGIFDVYYLLLALVMVMLGGMGAFPGAVIGAFVITFLNDALLLLGVMRLIILGTIVVAVMIAMPQGLMQIPKAVNRLIRQRASKRTSG